MIKCLEKIELVKEMYMNRWNSLMSKTQFITWPSGDEVDIAEEPP